MTQFLAFDIGGTFTDIVLLDTESSIPIRTTKLLTTPSDPTDAVTEGYDRVVGDGAPVDRVVHATTLATNALIERRGARTALIVTEGFRDVLEMGYERRWDTYSIDLEFTPPLIERALRLEVHERMLADGSIDVPLDNDSVHRAVAVMEGDGVESVAVCLMHAYRNSDHEERVGRLIAEAMPDVSVSLSSDVMPAIREYERTTTVAANAYIRPIIERYFRRLVSQLAERGYRDDVLIMLSNGGTADVGTAGRYPVRMIESGPAAGAIAAAAHAKAMGMPRTMGFDMGGTTAKVCIINDYRAETSTELEVARADRAKKSSGIPIKVPSVELIEIGAGGGSIARLNKMGLLQVGPESAGADPGPVAYARGGTVPTCTDANVVLGYIGVDSFLGGTMSLDGDAAHRSIARHISEPLGIGVVEAAQGIFDLVNENMASAARIHAVERGVDPRRYPIIAFGGAGPVHAYYVALKLGVQTVVVPPAAGTLSALGLLVAPVGMDFVRSHVGRVEGLDRARVEATYGEMTEQAIDLLGRAGIPKAKLAYRRTADMRYAGQGHEVSVELPATRFTHLWSTDTEAAASMRQLFQAAYTRLYGMSNAGLSIEILNWRLVATGDQIVPMEHVLNGSDGTAEPSAIARRDCHFLGHGLVPDVPVYNHYSLIPGQIYAGPAIVQQWESTAGVGVGGSFTLDEHRRLRITVGHP
jgi:N-methylhydantoinase A/oxoprolinase/acetone carboxylase beta subunit